MRIVLKFQNLDLFNHDQPLIRRHLQSVPLKNGSVCKLHAGYDWVDVPRANSCVRLSMTAFADSQLFSSMTRNQTPTNSHKSQPFNLIRHTGNKIIGCFLVKYCYVIFQSHLGPFSLTVLASANKLLSLRAELKSFSVILDEH
jgi:hypothetical protein